MMKQLYQNNLPQKQNNIYTVKLLKQCISGSNQVNQDLRGQSPKGGEISRSELCFRLCFALRGHLPIYSSKHGIQTENSGLEVVGITLDLKNKNKTSGMPKKSGLEGPRS